jgi:hypothetical protein
MLLQEQSCDVPAFQHIQNLFIYQSTPNMTSTQNLNNMVVLTSKQALAILKSW